ncbi:DUF1993 domain-containing protein [Lentilitoribacter sp. Alg239-R112]|uniref:DUF1993 domain-containing protein n=1 Tax=Lentilitoribacter sp. Alg239-R112 TaxID=2305987 RepID=UPI0013A6EC8B|nr:DUF1993 domain-containing protein [Lentilitoribacter sp. Alg239-R112]
MSVTNLLVPTYIQMLKGLAGWLDKAKKQLPEAEAEALLSVRLAPDMYPLSSQVSFVCFQAQEAVYRLKQEPVPEALMQLAADGRNAGDKPGSLKDAENKIADALTFLSELDADALDLGAERELSLELPTGMIFDLTGEQYARDWALAQFYFHLNTAYAILRNQKIELGKADYVPHMFAYLRPGTMPQG